jgi:hypothetical protein
MSHGQGLALRQNSDRILDLRRATAVAHLRAQRVHAAGLVVSITVAALGVLAHIWPSTAAVAGLAGAAWTAVYAAVLAPWAARSQQISATLQEMLDTELFGMGWNEVAVGDRIPEDQVSDLSNRYRGNEAHLRDYYLVAAVPAPYDVLFCFEQNLAWGSKVRARYAQLLLSVAVLWTTIGLIVGFVAGLRVPELVSTWFVPSLGLLLLCLDTYRGQLSNIRERTRVRDMVVAASADPHAPPPAVRADWPIFARRVQDVLFQLRRGQTRTPVWFFRRFHDRDQRDFSYRMRLLEDRINGSPSA